MEQYETGGLSQPLVIRPNNDYWLMVGFVAVFFVGGSIYVMFRALANPDSPDYWTHVVFGALGAVMFSYYVSHRMVHGILASDRGKLAISEKGLYLYSIGKIIPWEDVGTAWAVTWYREMQDYHHKHQHLYVKLRNKPRYRRDGMTWFMGQSETDENGLLIRAIRPFYVEHIDGGDLAKIINDHAQIHAPPDPSSFSGEVTITM